MERQYKDSGIEWIGRIPKEWKTCKLNYVYRFQTGATPPTNNEVYFDGNIKWASIADLKSKVINDTAKTLSKEGVEKCSMSISPKGSLMYSFKLSVGIVSFCGEDMYTNEAIATFLNGYGYLPFLYYMAPLAIIQNANYNIYGAPILNQELIKGATIIVPPLPEQQQIVEFLDKKCSEIDSLIALQEQMIAQLTDYKQSIITEAVTKGLNPDAKLVLSGINWIGDVPKGWNRCAPLKWFTEIILGKMLQSNANSPTDTLEKYICAKDVHFDGVDYSDLKSMYYSPSEKVSYQVQRGDMLVVEGGAGAAGAAIVNKDIENTYIQNSIMIVRPKRNIDIRYARYVLFSIVSRGYVDYICNKATIPHFTKDKLSGTLIPMPSFDEQRAIAEHLDTKCGEIDKLIETKQQKIETLKDYKKSIIYEAVTGKTDLRDR